MRIKKGGELARLFFYTLTPYVGDYSITLIRVLIVPLPGPINSSR